jgi:hypothetical protein
MNLIGRLIGAFNDVLETSAHAGHEGHTMHLGNADTPPPIIPGTTVYRSEDGTTYFRFRIVRPPSGAFRVYIVEQPGYRWRPDDGHTTHRFCDDDDNHYICWDGRMATIGDALGVAGEWSELTLRYIRHGIRF